MRPAPILCRELPYFTWANSAASDGPYCFQRQLEAVWMRGRVEICGINTAKLPVLKHEENMALLAPREAGR